FWQNKPDRSRKGTARRRSQAEGGRRNPWAAVAAAARLGGFWQNKPDFRSATRKSARAKSATRRSKAAESGAPIAACPSNPGKPVEPLLAPERFGERVGHLDRGDPLGILEAEFCGGAQPQREAERVGDRLARISGGEDGLRVQRARHVEALGVVVGALERDVLGGEVGADALEEGAQVHARPLADIVPALDADVAHDPFLLRHRAY